MSTSGIGVFKTMSEPEKADATAGGRAGARNGNRDTNEPADNTDLDLCGNCGW